MIDITTNSFGCDDLLLFLTNCPTLFYWLLVNNYYKAECIKHGCYLSFQDY